MLAVCRTAGLVDIDGTEVPSEETQRVESGARGRRGRTTTDVAAAMEAAGLHHVCRRRCRRRRRRRRCNATFDYNTRHTRFLDGRHKRAERSSVASRRAAPQPRRLPSVSLFPPVSRARTVVVSRSNRYIYIYIYIYMYVIRCRRRSRQSKRHGANRAASERADTIPSSSLPIGSPLSVGNSPGSLRGSGPECIPEGGTFRDERNLLVGEKFFMGRDRFAHSDRSGLIPLTVIVFQRSTSVHAAKREKRSIR